MNALSANPPCIVFEDDHLLVVNKPSGMNTHAPSPYHGEGIYDWLRHREPRWADLSILHRLDKETSGLMVFGKTPEANRSLTQQFTGREVHKRYQFLTASDVTTASFTNRKSIRRAGERYIAVAPSGGGEEAETRFHFVRPTAAGFLWEAEPLTGRTHQIRVHAADAGIPILGDTLYGGAPYQRVCLHAAQLGFQHPVTARETEWKIEPAFETDARAALREAVILPGETDAWRVIHGAGDGRPGWYVEQLGGWLLSQGENELRDDQRAQLEKWVEERRLKGAYHKHWNRQVRKTSTNDASPRPLRASVTTPASWMIRENGLQFELSFEEGYSIGLFLDQRDNRRRLITGHIAAGFSLPAATKAPVTVLNTFAYTCGFSVAAAKSGAVVTSLDLSKKYLDWGRRNFVHNGLNPAQHDFIYGDAFDWMKRLAKKGRKFSIVILDPPTFSNSKERGAFRVEKDYGELVTLAVGLLEPDGCLLASTNAAGLEPEKFLSTVRAAVMGSARKIRQEHYVPQPPDFPITREEPAYLKTVWLRIG